MERIIRIANAACLIILLTLTSCSQNETFYFRNITWGMTLYEARELENQKEDSSFIAQTDSIMEFDIDAYGQYCRLKLECMDSNTIDTMSLEFGKVSSDEITHIYGLVKVEYPLVENLLVEIEETENYLHYRTDKVRILGFTYRETLTVLFFQELKEKHSIV